MLSTLARIWLTKSLKPFTFTNQYDTTLSYMDITSLGLYIHIPFCEHICSFCPYCKEVYQATRCEHYIQDLMKEIQLTTQHQTAKKEVTSLYIGGGTPSLAMDGLPAVIQELQKHFIIKNGIGIELHPDHITISLLERLKTMGITKISIGIQSFQEKFLTTLGRKQLDYETMFQALASVPFETVSMDFIFALPNQCCEDLIHDIEMAFQHGANHIAIYPFIDFTFTKGTIPASNKKAKRKLLDDITLYCQQKGYQRDSIWTFAKEKGAQYSSMTRDNFLGFGCSATTLLHDQFKINTFSYDHYHQRIQEQTLPTSLTIHFTKHQRMVYYLFWTAYTTHIDPQAFQDFFHVPLSRVYGFEFWLAKRLGFLSKSLGNYHLTLKGAFYYHHFESYYTLSYIDKMWGIMREEAFPTQMKL